jgi:hypothetical protein
MNNNSKIKGWALSVLLMCLSILSYAQTADLTSHQPTTAPPAGTTFEWHVGPLSSSPLVSTPTAVAPGVYYGFYNYGSACFSVGSPIRIIAPACPATTVDLNTAVDAAPAGSTLSYHSALPVSDANAITGTAITAAAVGTYYVAYNTIISGSSCYSEARPIVVIASVTPATPTASVTAQPTCATATGTITVSSPANGAGISYTVTGTSPVVAAVTNMTGVFAGLAAGTYSVTTTNAAGCISAATTLEVNAQPAADVCLDTDEDGITNVNDLDDDNDGILDTVEAAQANADMDGDGIPNSLDLDSDNDGISDLVESGNAAAIAADVDKDGQLSPTESAPGANGIPLVAETAEGGTVPAPKDQDGDGRPDAYDLDSDNDGINDLTESGNTAALAADTNGDGTLSITESPVGTDGIPNVAQAGDGGTVPTSIDTDGDGIPNFRDLDSDNDGINDIVEAGVDPDVNGDGQVDGTADADNDGIIDTVDANPSVFGDPSTTDSPAPAVLTPNGPVITGPDPDGDGIVGIADDLPNTFGDNNCVAIEIGGIVYNDSDGVTVVNGAPIDGPALGVHMTLVQGTTQKAVVPVNATGNYKFTGVLPGTYQIVLGTSSAGSTAVSLPSGYYTSSEGGTVISGVSQNDATHNSKTTVTVDCAAITYVAGAKVAATANYLEVDFGITLINPLPINLVTFNGKQNDEQIDLTWKTASEKNFSHFEVQKSGDAKEFATIATVKGNQAEFYNLVDANPIEGNNYYKLKMVDQDGTANLSKTIMVNYEKGGNYISVENPAVNGEFMVMTNLKNAKFTLLSTLGSKVETSIVSLQNNRFKIKAMNTSAGLYYLTIEANGKFITKKILMP